MTQENKAKKYLRYILAYYSIICSQIFIILTFAFDISPFLTWSFCIQSLVASMLVFYLLDPQVKAALGKWGSRWVSRLKGGKYE